MFSSRGIARALEEAWRSGCWRRATSRSTGRCASFGAWRTSRRCSWRWCVWRRSWVCAARQAVDRRDEGACEREQAQGDSYDRMQEEGGWKARSRRCYARRTRPTRPRTRAWARRFGAMSRRSCVGGRSVSAPRGWKRRLGRRTTRGVGSRGRTGTRRAGRRSGRAGREGAEQLHGPGKLDHGRATRDSSSATTRRRRWTLSTSWWWRRI